VNHYCPECAVVQHEFEIESYTCQQCKDGFCVHFMKTVNAPKMIEPPVTEPGFPAPKIIAPGKWTKGEYICWVCGSEKKKEGGTP
jgi:hypothetical protein